MLNAQLHNVQLETTSLTLPVIRPVSVERDPLPFSLLHLLLVFSYRPRIQRPASRERFPSTDIS